MFMKGNYWIKKVMGLLYFINIYCVVEIFRIQSNWVNSISIYYILSYLKIMCDKYFECIFKKYLDYLRAIFIKYIFSFSGSRSKIDVNYFTLVGKFFENVYL